MNTIYGYIYVLTNHVNGKVYIGQTHRDPEIRRIEHFDKCHNKKVQEDMDLHGKKNFTFEVIANASTRDELAELERSYIKQYDAMNPEHGYNLCAGGHGPNEYKWTEEDKQKASEDRQNSRWFHKADGSAHTLVRPENVWMYEDDPAWLPGYGPGRYRGPDSEETKRKKSDAAKNHKRTSEHSASLSRALKAKNIHWYTNGEKDIQLSAEDEVPEGFVRGRKALVTDAYRVKCGARPNKNK